jgi:hypothetical protein
VGWGEPTPFGTEFLRLVNTYVGERTYINGRLLSSGIRATGGSTGAGGAPQWDGGGTEWDLHRDWEFYPGLDLSSLLEFTYVILVDRTENEDEKAELDRWYGLVPKVTLAEKGAILAPFGEVVKV